MPVVTPTFVRMHVKEKRRPLPTEPTAMDRALRLLGAIGDIVRSGGALVPEAVKLHRLDLCANHCPGKHWRPEGNLGLGKCALCGCCRLKHEFAATTCPIGVWGKYEPPANSTS